MGSKIIIYPDHETLSQAAANIFVDIATRSIRERGNFSVALSGGSTPQPLYQALKDSKRREKLDWENVHLFWGDERCVPKDHQDSNYRMVKDNLLQFISIPAENVHRVPAELDPRMAAFSYEETLRSFFTKPLPRFDLVLLGMGKDGHTASLFPHSAGLNEEERWFIANFAPGKETWRLTLTKNAINAARNILVLVAGSSKADMLSEVLEGEYQPFEKPIQFISPLGGDIAWLIDEAAVENLSDQG